jgi:CRISPR-associated protein Csd2
LEIILMRADQMMSRHVITIGVDAPLVDAINTMLKHGVSGLQVVDEAGKLVGILSKSDFLRRAEIGTERKRGRLLTFLAGPDKVAKDKSLNPQSDEEAKALTKFMCDNFFDVRAFGAVMGTSINAGQVRGPVQVAFAKSVQPILPLEISITQMAATNEKEKADREKGTEGDERTENRTMGRKHIVPYGLYRAHLFINAKLAERTGFGQDDLDHVFDALKSMFEHDRSAARGEMASRRVIAFKHSSALGNAPAHQLFDRVSVQRKFRGDLYGLDDDRLDNAPPARCYEDYEVSLRHDELPEGVEIVNIL